MNDRYIADHNAEAAAVWAAFQAGSPLRPPVYLGTNTQFFIFNQELNPGEKMTFEVYYTNGRHILPFQLRAAAWCGNHTADKVKIHLCGNATHHFPLLHEEVAAETERIINSGLLEGGKFILREGNNLAPGTPEKNLGVMYNVARAVSYS